MRGRVRWRVKQALKLMNGGYKALIAGEVPHAGEDGFGRPARADAGIDGLRRAGRRDRAAGVRL